MTALDGCINDWLYLSNVRIKFLLGRLFLFLAGFLGIDGGVFAGVGYGGDYVDEGHGEDDEGGYVVEDVHGDGEAEEGVGVGYGGQGGDGYEQCVCHNDDDAEFGGAEFEVGQAEFAFEVGVDADVDGEDKVDGVGQQGKVEMEEGREACADEHEAFVDAVDGVVDIVAVDGALAVADTCQGAVERVAKPVDKQSEGTEPEPLHVEA